jgi:threonine/homoserine efflux transporter RhtA
MKLLVVVAIFGLIVFTSVAIFGVVQHRWLLTVLALLTGICWVIFVFFTYKTARLGNG